MWNEFNDHSYAEECKSNDKQDAEHKEVIDYIKWNDKDFSNFKYNEFDELNPLKSQTLSSKKPDRCNKFKYDMEDHGSSREDTDVSQSEPEICGDQFLHDTMEQDETVLTDNEDKFLPDFDDSDDEMPIYSNRPSNTNVEFKVDKKLLETSKYRAILSKVLELRDPQTKL